jgi:hypothetical protein
MNLNVRLFRILIRMERESRIPDLSSNDSFLRKLCVFLNLPRIGSYEAIFGRITPLS